MLTVAGQELQELTERLSHVLGKNDLCALTEIATIVRREANAMTVASLRFAKRKKAREE